MSFRRHSDYLLFYYYMFSLIAGRSVIVPVVLYTGFWCTGFCASFVLLPVTVYYIRFICIVYLFCYFYKDLFQVCLLPADLLPIEILPFDSFSVWSWCIPAGDMIPVESAV
nr:hypothetical protein [uncultured bacterium]